MASAKKKSILSGFIIIQYGRLMHAFRVHLLIYNVKQRLTIYILDRYSIVITSDNNLKPVQDFSDFNNEVVKI